MKEKLGGLLKSGGIAAGIFLGATLLLVGGAIAFGDDGKPATPDSRSASGGIVVLDDSSQDSARDTAVATPRPSGSLKPVDSSNHRRHSDDDDRHDDNDRDDDRSHGDDGRHDDDREPELDGRASRGARSVASKP